MNLSRLVKHALLMRDPKFGSHLESRIISEQGQERKDSIAWNTTAFVLVLIQELNHFLVLHAVLCTLGIPAAAFKTFRT